MFGIIEISLQLVVERKVINYIFLVCMKDFKYKNANEHVRHKHLKTFGQLAQGVKAQ